MSENWWQYVERVANGATQKAIADAIGVDKTTVWRWKNGSSDPDPAVAIRFASKFKRPVTEALLAAGAIEPSQAQFTEVIVKASPSDLTDEELAAEVAKRLTGR